MEIDTEPVNDRERARQLLPDMPQEVFDIWIADLIKLVGWPFTSIDQPVTIEWARYFWGMSLETVSKLDWHRQSFPFALDAFLPIVQKRLNDKVLINRFGGAEKAKAAKDSMLRWERALAHIEKEGKLPAPVILHGALGNFGVFDGTHRLSAVLYLTMSIPTRFLNMQIPCWVTEIPRVA